MQPSRRCASTNGSIMPLVCACSRIQRSDRMPCRVRNGAAGAHQFRARSFLWMSAVSQFRALPANGRPIRAQAIHKLCYFCLA